MKNKKIFLLLIFAFFFFKLNNVYAFDVSNYQNRSLCGTFEVAGFHSDGVIDKVACYSTYTEAKSYMISNGADDLAIMTKVNGSVKIIDANVALLDLSVNPTTNTYFYENSELTSRIYTYMDTGSAYGGVDGALMDSSYSNSKGVWTAKVRIGNFTGWISQEAYEVVPLTWVKSSSSYTVTSESIRHNYVAKIQNTYSGSSGSTIGPKPDMLSVGTYYSYDGHYFYKDLKTLIKDYRNDTYDNSVNKSNPYYNYYMYLSNHSKTNYSSTNIDEYIRNNLGYSKNVYGNAKSSGTSRLYGSGIFFYYAQEKYGVNALLSLSLSRNETDNGRSDLAINKNNGFGLNAVDSNPIEAANWYASFASSILGYASKWITYGYAKPTDYRYFGPQFGDKWIGMNVKYASDTYWSEKMAANYYSMDKALGLQDYNYYQLGVVTGPTVAYSSTTATKAIYTYPEAEDGVLIVGETTLNNEKWYKVVSDMNMDSNYNILTSGDYNWNYVYVKASNVKKINTAKNGYVSPEDVYEYQDKDYEYDLYVEDTELKPKVAVTLKDTAYYYDSILSTKTGQTLLKDRYVMVYTAAYLNNKPVAYLVTSDYKLDQKHWVSADSIKFTTTSYGKVSVTASGNQFTWVNYNTDDASYSLISGLYTNSYVPVLEQTKVGNDTWYKVPVSLSSNDNIYGYTLSSADNVSITLSTPTVENTVPIITASDVELIEGDTFNELDNVKATDNEDGDLTNSIKVTENTVDVNTPGTYKVTYQVTDSSNSTTTKTIKVTVKENNAPVINASNTTITQGDNFDVFKDVTAEDKEDGDITSKLKVIENRLNNNSVGDYKIVYEVTDNNNKTTTKEITVTVVANQLPEITVKDKTIYVGNTFNELSGVTATDKEDGDLTNSIKVTENTVDVDTPGTYKVTYQVTDSYGDTTTKTIKVEVTEKKLIEEDGEFYLNSINWNSTTSKFSISGYLIILNQNNTNNKEYKLILEDINSDKTYEIDIASWTSNVPYDLGEENGKSYSNSWFKDNIDFSDIPNGDYNIYMEAIDEDYYSKQQINNMLNIDINRRGEDNNHGYNFTVQQKLKSKSIELNVRDELYTTKESPTYRNMTNDFDEISFKNNKLYIYGYSYNYGATYNTLSAITRTLIIEDTTTYKQYYYNLGSTLGPFDIVLADKLSKSYAWYEQELDISNLPKGTYSLQVYTKTSNTADYGELNDSFKSLKVEKTINSKKYTVYSNKNRNYRVELSVE